MWRLAADRTVALRKNRDFRHLAKIRRAVRADLRLFTSTRLYTHRAECGVSRYNAAQGERYVAFHIRLSDNIGTLASDWAFDARYATDGI